MNPGLIVSLTSFPAALGCAAQAIRSILEGTVLPDKILLYLTASQFPDRVLPDEIEAIEANEPRFEVRFWEENIRSYTKLVPALHDFPEDIIITIDDDVRYDRRLVEMLMKVHGKYPDAIVGHRVRRIEFDREGNLKPYGKWKRYKKERYVLRSLKPNYRNLATGVGGVLYPPHSLDPEMLVPELFMKLAPTVDDIWLWASAVSRGTKTAPVPFGAWEQDDMGKPEDITLIKINNRSGVDVNRNVTAAILDKYPAIEQRVEKKKTRLGGY